MDERTVERLLGVLDTSITDEQAVEGLGAVLQRKPTATEVKALNQARSAVTKKKYLEENLTTGKKMLLARSAPKPLEKQKFTDQVIYFSRNLRGLGTEYIFDANASVGVGYSNLDKDGNVPKGVEVEVERIELDFANELITVSVVEASAWSGIFSNTGITALINSDIEILVDDKVVLRRMVRDFCYPKSGNPTGNEQDNGLNLNTKIRINSGSKINARIVVPSGTTIEDGTTATNEIFVMCKLYGDGLRLD